VETKHKHRKKKYNILTYEKGALNTRGLQNGFLKLSKTNLIINTNFYKGKVVEAKVIPGNNKIRITVTYKVEFQKEITLDSNIIAGADLGLNNLMAVSTNQKSIENILVNGKPLKSINQFYNKKVSLLKSKLPKEKKTSNQIITITEKRNNKIDDFLHKSSKTIIDWLIENKISKIIIGNNPKWKQNINIGKKNNQNFVQIPHSKLITMISYKFESVGGKVIVQEESYTSKASALDLDFIPVFPNKEKNIFSGKRIHRGLYRTKKGKLINADINGSINIIRKATKNIKNDLVEDAQFVHHCSAPKFI